MSTEDEIKELKNYILSLQEILLDLQRFKKKEDSDTKKLIKEQEKTNTTLTGIFYALLILIFLVFLSLGD